MLAGVGTLATAARYRAPNLVVLVCDNGVYGTVGGGTVESATRHGAELAAIARASGWDPAHVIVVETPGDAAGALARAFADPGPWCIVARVAHTPNEQAAGAGQIPLDVVESAAALRGKLLERRSGAEDGAQ
jgi:thiamine pyrophosphate-dependent acetolactate synthase large subunit-like protein